MSSVKKSAEAGDDSTSEYRAQMQSSGCEESADNEGSIAKTSDEAFIYSGSTLSIESSKTTLDSSLGGKSFPALSDVSFPESSIQDSSCKTGVPSGDKNTPMDHKEKFFRWLPKSPKKFFTNVAKGFKSPTKSTKRIHHRVLCSSQVESDVANWTFNQISPIPNHLVDRIDYTSLAEDKVIPTFLSSKTCYDVMPTSGKVVVLSVELLVKNAFEALVSNELRAAPLWDVNSFSFVGMLTISDFINVLRYYYCNAQDDIKDIESQSIATWRRINKTSKPFIKVNGMDNLAQATKLLIEEGVHRIPVFDEGRQCVLFVLTRKRLLHYLYYNIIEKFGKTVSSPSFLSKSISELQVGTFDDIAKVTNTTKVIEALDLFIQRKVSALPIVDEKNILIDIFGKFDVFALAKEQTYHNLDMTISEAIDKGKVHEDVYGCTLDDTLGTVIHTFVTTKAHRLVVIDEKKSVVGMISLSDILKFLVVQPLVKMEESGASLADTIDETPEGLGESEKEDSVFLDTKEATGDKSVNLPDKEIPDSKDPVEEPDIVKEASKKEDTPKTSKVEE